MKYQTIFARLMANIHEPENEQACWIWKASKRSSNGYGRLNFYCEGDYITLQAHCALALLFEIGTNASVKKLVLANHEVQQAGMEWNHLCCNRLCINPDHLELVTPKENIAYIYTMRAKVHRQQATARTY